jgi:rare lipoprotein A
MRRAIAGVALLLGACVSSTPAPPKAADVLRGTASWYGQEFAGRATANGEIFDPMQLTAAHRTLPFGTVLEVKNTKTSQAVRVRINDRGPYIGNRVIDLSYAAAQEIGLIEPGSGEVVMTVVAVGKGEREPPAAYVVNVPEVSAAPAVPIVVEPPKEEPRGIETRRQVSADGKRIEEVEVIPLPAAPARAPAPAPQPVTVAPRPVVQHGYVVQVGAFAQEANAKLLQDQLVQLGEKAYIDRTQLYRVRIGPVATRDEAIRIRSRLEASGLSAIIVTQ